MLMVGEQYCRSNALKFFSFFKSTQASNQTIQQAKIALSETMVHNLLTRTSRYQERIINYVFRV